MEKEEPQLNWGHININVRNLERSLEFYRKLGFEIFIPAIPYLALQQGSRPSEYRMATWSEIDFEKNCMVDTGRTNENESRAPNPLVTTSH